MTWRRELHRGILVLTLLATVLSTVQPFLYSEAADDNSTQQAGTLVSVRKVLGTHYFVSRYPQIHYYELYISVRVTDQTYCGEYETPVLDEIEDASAAQGKSVQITLKEKRLTVITPKGFRLKAHIVEPKQC